MTREEFEILDSWVYTKIKMNRDYYSRAKIIEMIMERVETLVKPNESLHNVMRCSMCDSTNLEDCGGDEYSCKDCGHFPITA